MTDLDGRACAYCDSPATGWTRNSIGAIWPCCDEHAAGTRFRLASPQPGADESGFGGDAPEPYDGPRLVTSCDAHETGGDDPQHLVTAVWLAEVTAERDEARAATARVRALCAGADDSEYTTVFAAAVLAALDVRHDPSAPTDDDYYVIEVDPETARLNVTYPSATTEGGAS